MSPKTILIRGANRGIGFSVLQALATRSPSDHYLLAARSTEKGKLAMQELRKSGVQAEIDVVQLDVTKESSIKAAEQEVRKRFGRIDILVQQRWDRYPRKARRLKHPRKLRSDLQHQHHWRCSHDDHIPTSHEEDLSRRLNHQRFFRSRLSSSIIDRQSSTIKGDFLLGQQDGSQRFDGRVRTGRAYCRLLRYQSGPL